MAEPKNPSRNYIAKALAHNSGGWVAQWACPGMIPIIFKDKGSGQDAVFPSETAARHAAQNALVHALINRDKFYGRQIGKPERYNKLSGDEFAELLAHAGLDHAFFAYLFGTTLRNVLMWQDGTKDVPHPARLLLEIFKRHPSTIDLAEDITERVTTERNPRHPRGEDIAMRKP
jgi:DNA-binding transcriptional regulator YiaG